MGGQKAAFILFSILFCMPTTWANLDPPTTFEKLRSCLISVGLNSTRIVPRGVSDRYKSLNRQWQTRGGQIYPIGYILPNTTSHVQQTILCAKKFGIRVVSKSGGHSLAKYSFGNNETVVLDLRHLNSVVQGPTWTDIGAGAVVGEIGWKLWQNSKVIISNGVCPSVGISGLATGGGLGYFSGLHGLTLDQVIEIDMVNSKGQLLTTSSSSNPDLYWALRGGGGGSFGVVTRLRLQTHPAPDTVLYSNQVYDLSAFPKVLFAWQNLLASNPPRQIYFSLKILNRQIILKCIESRFGTRGSNQLDRILSRFPPTLNRTLTTFTYPELLVHDFGAPEPRSAQDYENLRRFNVSRYLIPKNFYATKDLDHQNITKLYGLLKVIPKGCDIFMETYLGAVKEVTPSSTAFVHRPTQGQPFMFLWYVRFNLKSPTELEKVEGSDWIRYFYNFSHFLYGGHNGSYQNYPDPELKKEEYLSRYYGSNLGRLIQVKNQVYPEDYFRFPQSIPLKL